MTEYYVCDVDDLGEKDRRVVECGDRQVPGNPRVGLAQVYGAPGTASATIVSPHSARPG